MDLPTILYILHNGLQLGIHTVQCEEAGTLYEYMSQLKSMDNKAYECILILFYASTRLLKTSLEASLTLLDHVPVSETTWRQSAWSAASLQYHFYVSMRSKTISYCAWLCSAWSLPILSNIAPRALS